MKILKNKKGAGMELAIFVLMVVFAFCSLIISLYYSLSVSKRNEDENLKSRTVLDRIGEKFVELAINNSDDILSITNVREDSLKVSVSGESPDYTMTVKKDEKDLFIVEVSDGKVVRWQYLF